jgi:DNA repair exonuclease SbcCD ATPase subunit
MVIELDLQTLKDAGIVIGSIIASVIAAWKTLQVQRRDLNQQTMQNNLSFQSSLMSHVDSLRSQIVALEKEVNTLQVSLIHCERERGTLEAKITIMESRINDKTRND